MLNNDLYLYQESNLRVPGIEELTFYKSAATAESKFNWHVVTIGSWFWTLKASDFNSKYYWSSAMLCPHHLQKSMFARWWPQRLKMPSSVIDCLDGFLNSRINLNLIVIVCVLPNCFVIFIRFLLFYSCIFGLSRTHRDLSCQLCLVREPIFWYSFHVSSSPFMV